MRVLLLALLLVAPAAGCIERLRGLEPDPPVGTVLPWSQSGCTFVVAIVPVAAARLQDRLPPGFRSLTPAELELPDDPRGDANLGVEAWRCAEAVGHNESVTLNDVAYGALFSFVEPPAELVDNASQYHFVKWDVLVPDRERRDLLMLHGLPAYDGNATFPRFQPVQDAVAFDVGLELNGTWTIRGTTVNPEPGFQAFAFTEYTATPHGLAKWTTNATAGATTSGAGFLTSTSAFFREVAGSDRAQAYVIAGSGGAFANGTLTLPALPIE